MNGTYGTNKPAFITSGDVDIFYSYRPSRSTESTDFKYFKKLSSSLLATVSGETDSTTMASVITLPGMYDLRLPADKFGKVGIYTIYIKPKEIYTKIVDVSTLSSFPNIKGIILSKTDLQSVDETFDSANGSLVGYRVEYFNTEDTSDREDFYRIITSSNKCEPISQNLNDTTGSGIRYRFNDSSNLIFCTLSPSTAMSFKSSSAPYIGTTEQKIALINTKLNPIMLEVEMVEHDIETVSTMLEGKQIRNLDSGLITTFDDDGGIYYQATYGNITNSSTGLNHDFKFNNKNNVNTSEIDRLDEIEKNV